MNEEERVNLVFFFLNTSNIFSYSSASSYTSHKMLNNSGNIGTLALFLTVVKIFLAFPH